MLCGRLECLLRYTFEYAESFQALFFKKYSLKRKVIRTGKKGAEVVPADDLEKANTEEVQAAR
jgi:hypothetical protein